jgi:hypothetical protein
VDPVEAARRLKGQRKGWKSINLPAAQYERVRQACEGGAARNNDEFVRIWTEVGLVLTNLAALRGNLPPMAAPSVQEPVPVRGP